jgi:hypothetical protein
VDHHTWLLSSLFPAVCIRGTEETTECYTQHDEVSRRGGQGELTPGRECGS